LKKTIELSDILHPESYKKVRKEKKKLISVIKKNRRISVGPHATFFFENYETIWHQIHEMMYIEKGGYEQAVDEITAYKTLVPSGSNLIATLMFEIDNRTIREEFLKEVSGIENCIEINIDGSLVLGVPEQETERTRNDGKTSAVHFMHFSFTKDDIKLFKDIDRKTVLSFTHENYSFTEEIGIEMKKSLINDFG